jgi:hypothetical protein
LFYDIFEKQKTDRTKRISILINRPAVPNTIQTASAFESGSLQRKKSSSSSLNPLIRTSPPFVFIAKF